MLLFNIVAGRTQFVIFFEDETKFLLLCYILSAHNSAFFISISEEIRFMNVKWIDWKFLDVLFEFYFMSLFTLYLMMKMTLRKICFGFIVVDSLIIFSICLMKGTKVC